MGKLSARTEKTSGFTDNDLIHVVNGGSSWKVKLVSLAPKILAMLKALPWVAADFPTLNQDTTGTAAKANQLSTTRTFAISGDVVSTSAQNFNGTANVSIPVVLSNLEKLSKVVYIDGDLGNDATGSLHTALKPYKTISAAYTDYVATVATPTATDRVLFIVSKITIAQTYSGVDYLSLTDSVVINGALIGEDAIFYGRYNIKNISTGSSNQKIRFVDCELTDVAEIDDNFRKSGAGTYKIGFENCKINLKEDGTNFFILNTTDLESYFYNCKIISQSKALIKNPNVLVIDNCVAKAKTEIFIDMAELEASELFIRESYIDSDTNEVTISGGTTVNLYGNVFLKNGIAGGSPDYGTEINSAPAIPIL